MANETVKKAGKFGVIGISNTLIDLGIFNILTLVFGAWIVIANVISVSVAIVNSYIWNKAWGIALALNWNFIACKKWRFSTK